MNGDKYKSCVQWPLSCYRGKYGDGVSTDTHPTKEAAQAVLRTLEREGFGCDGEWFPIRTWIEPIGEKALQAPEVTLPWPKLSNRKGYKGMRQGELFFFSSGTITKSDKVGE